MAAQMNERVVRASKLNFTVLEIGEGPLVLCLHGFPDTAHSFRNQMPALADAGYHAVAPFMRGYAPTEPAPDGRYDSPVLSEDALALIEALGYQEAVLFGHDWGAVAAYGAAARAPNVVQKLITAAVPYGTSFFQALVTNYAQQRRSWYMFFFQTAIAETAVSLNDFAFLEKMWRDWSPGWNWTQPEMEALKRCFRAKGTLEAALGYYRATLGPVLKIPAQPSALATAMAAPIEVPTLMFHGRDDGCIGAELLSGMEALFPRGLKIDVVPGAGHFVHQEKPDHVNRLMLQFLRQGI
ncbi:MAG: alpha/beta hydrolase [Candidatus Binatus sp.]|uniref:alpha/beta fold hydrolase n=1 Tax=Candidatus Binatus sp. TaxID=2811406 RepID=UPI002727FA89|nr:alpha/beta hydrolase [Candidatus Binatus sp.]MDO8434770.1 alpha/beta hydrolase [Candidatus Binatus sp.]